MTKRQLGCHADLRQLMVVEAFQLVLAVVDAVKCRREHDQKGEDDAKNKVVTGLWEFVHLLHDCPANIKYSQIHLVHRIRLPYHTTHYTAAVKLQTTLTVGGQISPKTVSAP